MTTVDDVLGAVEMAMRPDRPLPFDLSAVEARIQEIRRAVETGEFSLMQVHQLALGLMAVVIHNSQAADHIKDRALSTIPVWVEALASAPGSSELFGLRSLQ